MLNSSSNQVSLFDLDSELHELKVNKSDQLFCLFTQFIDVVNEIIPTFFHNAYYSDVGKQRFPLDSMLKTLVFYNLLNLLTISTLILTSKFQVILENFLIYP